MSTAVPERIAGRVEEPPDIVLAEAVAFVGFLEAKDRELRRRGSPLPTAADKAEVADRFRELFSGTERAARRMSTDEAARTKARFRTVLDPWLMRSRHFWRSSAKPQGYAGDFTMIEWMYDLERSAGDDPHQAAIVNCLDHAFATIDSVVSLWERRRWLRDLVIREVERRPTCSVLDVACGGARYLADALSVAGRGDAVRLNLVDQDPSALLYARDVVLPPTGAVVTSVNTPIKKLASALEAATHDVVISSGLFDYLSQVQARALVATLAESLVEGGVLAVTNYHREDGSAFVKDWAADWSLVFRDEDEMADMFRGSGLRPTLTRSANGSLVMATARRGA